MKMICIYDCQHGKYSCEKCIKTAKEANKNNKEWFANLLLTGRNEEQVQAELKKSADNFRYMTKQQYQKEIWNEDGTLK